MNLKNELLLVVSNVLLIALLFFIGSGFVQQIRLSSHPSSHDKVKPHISQVKLVETDESLRSTIKKESVPLQVDFPLHKFTPSSVHQETSAVGKTLSKPPEKTESESQTAVKTDLSKGKSNKSTKQEVSGFQEVYQVPKGYCALTFDDGPSDYTKKIGELLKNNGAPATFFVIGTNVHTFPDSIRYLSQLGFKVEDHSETHPEMSKLSASAQAKQILQAKREVEDLTHEKVTMFRPPYGDFNNVTKELLAKNHMKMALWNDDPRDWDGKTAKQIIQTLSRSQLNGKIIDLHEKKETYEALPEILKIIKKQGLKLVLI